MTHLTHPAAGKPQPFAVATLGRRVWSMSLLWAFLGVAIGLSTAPGTSAVALISGAIAGVIVLCPLGVVLGLLGGQVKETQLGGLLGLCLGGAAGVLLGPVNALFFVNVGLLMGALGGGLTFALIRRARQLATFLAVQS
jgi:hypothetical protein